MASRKELEAAERAFGALAGEEPRIDPSLLSEAKRRELLERAAALRAQLEIDVAEDIELAKALGAKEPRSPYGSYVVPETGRVPVPVSPDELPQVRHSWEAEELLTPHELYQSGPPADPLRHTQLTPAQRKALRDEVHRLERLATELDFEEHARYAMEANKGKGGWVATRGPIGQDDWLKSLARAAKGTVKNVIPLGVMAKILGGGAAKAAGPGAEALLFAGHEKPNIREALAADADMLAGAMGLPTGYQDPTAINREDAATLEAAIEGARRRGIDIRGKASYRAAYPEGVRADPDSSPLSPDQLENYLALRAEAARSGRPMGTPRETRPTVEMTGRQ